MKKAENKEYFNVIEIYEMLNGEVSKEKILDMFEREELEGIKKNGEWLYAKEKIQDLEKKIIEERVHYIGNETLDLSDLKIEGKILDIGGGGEGIIGQIFEEKVIAIDPSKRELEEIKRGDFIKVVMDGKDLKFIDKTFENVTSFFTMMYIPYKDHKKVFEEIYRVLKEGGFFYLWDLNIPKKKDNPKDIIAIKLKIHLSTREIETGYGTRWNKEQNRNHFIELGKNVGFDFIEEKKFENTFFLKFKK